MAARAGVRATRKQTRHYNWLEELDRRVGRLPAGPAWLSDSHLSSQRCLFFIMARFTALPRPFPDEVIGDIVSREQKRIDDSAHAERILRGLNADQRGQLASLLFDVKEALACYNRHGLSSKMKHKLASEVERRTRVLFRRVSKIQRELNRLKTYAERLHPLLGFEYIRAAKRCESTLEKLKEEESAAGEYYRGLKSEILFLEDPRQLGMVELYWFFRHECRCGGSDSEVRVAILANSFLASSLNYTPEYNDDKSQGCPAVRIAISRFRPRTTN